MFQRVGGALIIFIGFMIAMVIAVPGFTPAKLIGALGIGSVAIGFAFKDIFQNLLSGILLLISEPFRIGDQIVSGDYEGTVEDIKIAPRLSRRMTVGKWLFPILICIPQH
nr:mechanosensitive ion channel domain-containing protein [Psychrobacter sp. WY6]